MSNRKITFIGVPLDLGAGRRGVDMGPSAIRSAGIHGTVRSLGYDVEDAGDVRRAKLGEAVRHVRQATGEEALMRVLEVDPDSRLPERRAVLAPFPEEGRR